MKKILSFIMAFSFVSALSVNSDTKTVLNAIEQEKEEAVTTMVSGAYIPDGIEIDRRPVEIVDDETAKMLTDICDRLKENVFSKYSGKENRAVTVDFVSVHSYVVYTSCIKEELDEAKKYCEENGIDSKYVMFWYADPDRNEIPEYNGVVYNSSVSFVTKNECGDTNGDSEIDLTDLTNISLYLLGDIDFTDAQKSSADVNADDKLDLCDLAVMKQYISKDDVTLGKGI